MPIVIGSVARSTLFTVALLVLTCAASLSQKPAVSQSAPIEVHLSQQMESTPLWLRLTDTLAWPLIVLIGVILFRKPLMDVAYSLISKGGEVTIGAIALRLPEIESKVKAQTEVISNQQEKISEQNDRIRNLIRYSMSGYIYTMLLAVKKAQASGGQYIFRNDGSMDRNLRFLIDHGYIQEVPHWPVEGENICPLVIITPSGYDVIAMRES